MKVDVYLNFNDGCVSVRSRESENYGIVVSHEEMVHVRDVEFVVQPAQREQCLAKGVKNVHAVVRGVWDESITVDDGDRVTYNPFKYEYFYSPDMDSYVEAADAVMVTVDGVIAQGAKPLSE